MFHDTNLPKHIEVFAVGSSEFTTSLTSSMSGRESRNSDTHFPRRRYTLKDCRLSLDQFELFNSFFKARAGRRFAFRLKDHFDYKVTKQVVAMGDGSTKSFQLKKIYKDKVSPYARVITRPIIKTIKIWCNDTLIQPESIDKNTGIICLNKAIQKDSKLIASFEFDVPVRFMHDSFQYSFNRDGTILLDNAELIEVLE